MLVYRIEPRSNWEAAHSSGVFLGELGTDGFIHLSRLGQVLSVANALYAGQSDLLLLEIETADLGEKLVFEDLYELGEEFPHLYSPLEPSTVLRAAGLRWTADGFVLPERGTLTP